MLEFYMVLVRKIINIPEFFIIFARKINTIPEFYMITARKMPEFYIIIARKYFRPNALPSFTPLFPGLSRPGNLNILLSELFRVRKKPEITLEK